MNVLFISPGFPAEMPLFTRGLAEIGARVLGLGDQPLGALPEEVRACLTAYKQVRNLWQEDETCDEVRGWLDGHQVDRVECLWEPGVVLAAKLRQALGVPGMSVEQAHAFRDKETMKQVLDRAGVRTPHHYRATSEAELREAVEKIGFPIIVKPIDGAGSADTYPCYDGEELERAIGLTRHVPEVSVEEYVEGEEYTFDTVCSNGEVLFHNIAWYRPKPLIARLNPWISSQAIAFRDTSQAPVSAGRDLGLQVLRALGFESGFTHMEWFYSKSGEAIFGEIGARAPGARLVHLMNYTADVDLFRGWAEAVCTGRIAQDTTKKYNACLIFKRAEGEGRILRYEGLQQLLGRYGEHVATLDLVPIGEPRRDWRKIVVGDGWLVARHPNLDLTLEMAERFCTDLRIVAG